jgi:hypothetical protein
MRIVACFILACFVGGAPAAAMHWQPAPKKPGMHQNRMAAKEFVLTQSDGATLSILHPDLVSSKLKLGENGRVKVKSTGFDNYHALIASRQADSLTETAIRYVYMRGKPSGHSPSEVVDSAKSELEIVPSPFPREHSRYQSNQQRFFKLLFKGEPLARHNVNVETSFGTTFYANSDETGLLNITIPDDFTNIKVGRRNNPAAEWRIAAVHNQDGHSYRTVVSAPYYADPSHWQPLSWGLLTVAGGMLVTGMMSVRRRKIKPARTGRASGKRLRK